MQWIGFRHILIDHGESIDKNIGVYPIFFVFRHFFDKVMQPNHPHGNFCLKESHRNYGRKNAYRTFSDIPNDGERDVEPHLRSKRLCTEISCKNVIAF